LKIGLRTEQMNGSLSNIICLSTNGLHCAKKIKMVDC
jgi:hypothetical protein